MDGNLSLDVDAPDEVPHVLRKAAEIFYESASELESAWQDKGAGKPWSKIARKLERTADEIEAMLG
jgi:hypothetical protein